MGGSHVSFDAENTLTRYPEIDAIIIGEGEKEPLCSGCPRQKIVLRGVI